MFELYPPDLSSRANGGNPLTHTRHCEERSDEAIPNMQLGDHADISLVLGDRVAPEFTLPILAGSGSLSKGGSR
jgi:hypothetical protein